MDFKKCESNKSKGPGMEDCVAKAELDRSAGAKDWDGAAHHKRRYKGG